MIDDPCRCMDDLHAALHLVDKLEEQLAGANAALEGYRNLVSRLPELATTLTTAPGTNGNATPTGNPLPAALPNLILPIKLGAPHIHQRRTRLLTALTPDTWHRPRDIGAKRSDITTYDLQYLVTLGFAEMSIRPTGYHDNPARFYRRTPAGTAQLAALAHLDDIGAALRGRPGHPEGQP